MHLELLFQFLFVCFFVCVCHGFINFIFQAKSLEKKNSNSNASLSSLLRLLNSKNQSLEMEDLSFFIHFFGKYKIRD